MKAGEVGPEGSSTRIHRTTVKSMGSLVQIPAQLGNA